MEKSILDACCGSKMFWFDRSNPDVIFMDNRVESHQLKDASSKGGYRELNIRPDIQASYESMPFPDNSFTLVVFDPPHLTKAGMNGWQAKKYGVLQNGWQEQIRAAFVECFRVLKPGGTLIFKWSEKDICAAEVLKLAPTAPLIGNRAPRKRETRWYVFMKPVARGSDE